MHTAVDSSDSSFELDLNFVAIENLLAMLGISFSKSKFSTIVLGGTAASHTFSGMGGGTFFTKPLFLLAGPSNSECDVKRDGRCAAALRHPTPPFSTSVLSSGGRGEVLSQSHFLGYFA
jgi:hypothetical protein